MSKINLKEIRTVYDKAYFTDEKLNELNGYYAQVAKNIIDGRKRREKETGEHFEPKYKMYIIPHKAFVSDYESYGRMKMSGKRYCFRMDSFKMAILLNIEEVINCIADCANEYCNWRFKIIPEDEFLKEFEDYKNKHLKDLEGYCYYGFHGAHMDIDNILKQPKQKKYCNWGCLMRYYYGEIGIFLNPVDAIPFYSLYSDGSIQTSAVVDYKITDKGIEIETINSIYEVKKLKEFSFFNQLKEFDDYKKSEEYNKLFKFIEEEENKIMKNIMEGKEYIN